MKEKPKVVRKRKDESPEEYQERFKQYRLDREEWKNSLPLEKWSKGDLETKCKELGLVCTAPTKERLVKRIRQAQSGEFRAESRTRVICENPEDFVPLQFAHPVLQFYYRAGTNAVAECIPKYVWKQHILSPYITASHLLVVTHVYEIRRWCKYFYEICTPILIEMAQHYFGVPDIKLWSLYAEMLKSDPLRKQINEISNFYKYDNKTAFEILDVAVEICGSAKGISLKLDSLKHAKEAKVVLAAERQEDREMRLQQVNDAFRAIGLPAFENYEHFRRSAINNIPILESIGDFLRRVLGIRQADTYCIRYYVRYGTNYKLFQKAFSYFRMDVLVFAQQFANLAIRSIPTIKPVHLADTEWFVMIETKKKMMETAFHIAFQQYEETNVMPDFEEIREQMNFQ